MSRRPDHIPPRKAIPVSVKRQVVMRSDGVCEALGCDQPACDLDHTIPVALGGENTADNIKALCREHHDAKTKLDVKMIAKADRQGGRSGQAKRRKDKPKMKGPRIQSRGFDKRFKKKLDGTVVPK